ncbi:MAG: response regulator [Nannocystaceae bacterium]
MKPSLILIVEDNLDLAENVAEFLGDDGHEVVIASRGDHALAIAREREVDLAILDVRLPDTTGVELVHELRPYLGVGEVVLMTGNASLDTAIAAVREGVFAYVQKPFDVADLLALAQRALGQVRLRRERKRLLHELERSEKLHRGIIEAVDTLIIGVDRRGLVQMWNPAATRSTGHENVAVLGQEIAALLFAEPERSAFAEWLALAWERRIDELEVEILTRGGGRRTVRWSQATILDDGITLLILIGHDVTDRLALEKRAADAEARASLATRTAGLAHEIRNR